MAKPTYKKRRARPKIIVVDLGSTDNTPDILKKLAGDYDFVQITDKEGYIKFIREMA